MRICERLTLKPLDDLFVDWTRQFCCRVNSATNDADTTASMWQHGNLLLILWRYSMRCLPALPGESRLEGVSA